MDEFKNDIDDINNYANNLLINYIQNAMSEMIKFHKGADGLNFTDIKFASKETHNSKKSVLIFDIGGAKSVYKPYDMNYHRILLEIFRLLKRGLKYDLEVLPKILHYDKDYSILEFIKEGEISDAKSFYYCVGAVLAFAYAMRIADLHSENILFGGKNLYILDVETCFYQSGSDEFLLSHTGLLKAKGNCGLFDSHSKEIHISLNENNEVSFLKHRAKSGKNLDVKNNMNLILSGFEDCFKAIVLNKKDIVDLIISNKFLLRRIFRPTSAYAAWLIALFTVSPNIKTNILRVKDEMAKTADANTYKSIIDAEITDMLITDIPYFYYNCENNGLYHGKELLSRSFYKNNFKDFISDWFNALEKQKFKIVKQELTSALTNRFVS